MLSIDNFIKNLLKLTFYIYSLVAVLPFVGELSLQNKGKRNQFCYHNIELTRDLLTKFQWAKKFSLLGILVDQNVILFGDSD